MLRSLSTALLVLGLAGAAATLPVPAAAQGAQARAYAPENLRQLSVVERVRVIEREYSDQSRGRQIPDDQLEFYLDQINAGWGFSRVKQDIATSLRGNHGGRPGAGWGGWNGSSWTGQTLTCSSNDRRRRECRTPFNGRPVLVENISGTRCVEGVNFGGGGGIMWVDKGCRGRFAEGRGGWQVGKPGTGQTIRCESRNNRETTCGTGFRGRAVLVRRLSDTRCVENRNWGQRGSNIWVSGGCRGEFAEAGGGWGGGANSSYSVTCSSENNRRRTCAWDRRQGRPVVIENISKTRCQENANWGWDGNQIWVDRGCRARFGAR
nr:DUF3011 domain-containing protein [Pseudoxanthomonas suwonensis]